MLAKTLRVSVGVLGASWKERGGEPGTHGKFPRSFSILKLSLGGRVPTQGCSCAFLHRAGTWAAWRTPKPWLALGLFCNNCANSSAPMHKLFSLLCFEPFSAVLRGLGLLQLSCEALAECWWRGFHRWCAQRYCQTLHLDPEPHSWQVWHTPHNKRSLCQFLVGHNTRLLLHAVVYS